MTNDNSHRKKILKNFFLFTAGSAVLILGIVLILVWWKDVEVLFRGGIGMILALGGLIILFLVKD